ncbi:SPO11 protein, partial [Atractosteus spatula]|nr:SPO11 protein [Atractosteus spatula]
MLRVPRRNLHVLASSKGFIAGDLCYTEEDGTKVNCDSGSMAVLVSSNVCGIKNFVSTAKFVLIVEKDATFQRLLDDEFCTKLAPCIMITVNMLKDAFPSMSFDAHNLTVPAVMWLGLLPSDIERLNVPKDALIPFTKRDHSKLQSLQKRPYFNSQPLWKKEIELMLKWQQKAEIQCLTSIAPDYLTRVYLPNKLRYGGWI